MVGEVEELHLGPQALMLVALVVAFFAVLGLKLLHQNSLHFTGRVYLLLDSSCSPVQSRSMKLLLLTQEKCRHLFPPLHLCSVG